MIGPEWIFPILKENGVSKNQLNLQLQIFPIKNIFYYTQATLISKGISLRKRAILTEQNGETSVHREARSVQSPLV